MIENHIHLKNKRIVEETGEIIIVQKGKIEVKIFDSEKNLLATEILNNNCIACFYGGGHGFKILTDTLFLEIKQGPYNEKLTKKNFMIRVFEPSISVKDVYSVAKSVLNKDISGSSKVKIFEENLAKYFQRKYSVFIKWISCFRCSISSFKFKERRRGHFITFTIISCLAAVIRSGATPIFCDVDGESWNLNLDDVKPLITNKTKAILIVHTYGLIVKADDFENFVKKNIVLIEDAAEAHGQEINNRKIGSFGLMSTFSFYANKHLTTGEGAILTDSEDVYKKLLQIRNLDFNLNKRFERNLYWNYRMSGLQAVGNSQLKKLNQNIINKLKQANIYNNLIKEANLDIKTHLNHLMEQ